jgi:hypothetical protein
MIAATQSVPAYQSILNFLKPIWNKGYNAMIKALEFVAFAIVLMNFCSDWRNISSE